MSHVAKISIDVKSLEDLEAAAKALGLRLERGAQTFRSFQRGLKCDHKITDPGNPNAYEIGVTKRADGKGFDLAFDEWAGAGGMVEKIGQGAKKLRQEYSASVATSYYRRKGFRVSRTTKEDGRIVLSAAK